MNTLLLHPTDTLFFRDGRPMSGSLSGHGAAWPLPTVLNAALHAALHRADLEKASGVKLHRHDHRRETETKDVRLFGSLLTAGPFPVSSSGDWFFPRPLDAGHAENDEKTGNITDATYQPLKAKFDRSHSSLPPPLQYPAANTQAASKTTPKAWWSTPAWNAYLNPQNDPSNLRDPSNLFISDADFSDTESTFGIGISAETGTQNGEQFYSAKYLRLREGWRLGCIAEAKDKDFRDKDGDNDLIPALFPNSGSKTPVIVGGQQRLCSVERHTAEKLPLPIGPVISGTRVKWVLLSPAIFPEIGEHTGGWLPSWVDHISGQVMLKQGNTGRHDREGRETWRKRVAEFPTIPAKLVAALTGKPIPVTGYALPNTADPDRTAGGAKSTHLAVPAGSVYYFEADTPEAAQALAAALNWHGAGDATTIRNRRSTLMGEKGFGLGVCGTWEFHDGKRPT